MNANDKIALNVADTAEMLGVSRPTDFPAARIGGRVLIPRDKLKDWLEAQAEVKA